METEGGSGGMIKQEKKKLLVDIVDKSLRFLVILLVWELFMCIMGFSIILGLFGVDGLAAAGFEVLALIWLVVVFLTNFTLVVYVSAELKKKLDGK